MWVIDSLRDWFFRPGIIQSFISADAAAPFSGGTLVRPRPPFLRTNHWQEERVPVKCTEDRITFYGNRIFSPRGRINSASRYNREGGGCQPSLHVPTLTLSDCLRILKWSKWFTWRVVFLPEKQEAASERPVMGREKGVTLILQKVRHCIN